MDDCKVLTVPEAGRLLGLGRNASYEAAKRGDLPVIKIGKLIRVPKAAFLAMLEGSAKETPAAQSAKSRPSRGRL